MRKDCETGSWSWPIWVGLTSLQGSSQGVRGRQEGHVRESDVKMEADAEWYRHPGGNECAQPLAAAKGKDWNFGL